MFSFSLVTPPSVEPISLSEAKAHARIDTTADDALIASLISGARQWAEKYTGRAFITQTWQVAIDVLPDGLAAVGSLRLPRAPLQSITSVQSFDDRDTATSWPSGNYFVDKTHEPGRLALRSGASWPMPTRTVNGIIVTYVAGYGDTAASVPEAIKTALRQLVAHWYEHRGEAVTAGAVQAPLVIQALLDSYRVRYTGL